MFLLLPRCRRCLLLLCALRSLVSAQNPTLKFNHLSIEQGLSQDIVTCIAQDARGFMWFGTEDGLNRYDGYSVKVYRHDPRDSTSISSNGIVNLLLNSQGILWVCPSGSVLNKYDFGHDAFTQIQLDASISSIVEDRKGNIWVGTSNGLRRVDGRSDHPVVESFIPDMAGSPDNQINTLLVGRSGRFWVGTGRGLASFDPLTHAVVHYTDSTMGEAMNGNGVGAVLEDSGGSLWLAHGGLKKFDPMTNSWTTFRSGRGPGDLVDDRVLSLCQDTKGSIWIGTFDGLQRLDPMTGMSTAFRESPNDPYCLKGNRIYSIFQDRAAALWFGTYRGGVNRLDAQAKKFDHYYHIADGPEDVLSIFEDVRGDIWLGVDQTVIRFDRGENFFVRVLSYPQSSGVAAFAEDRHGRMWIGTQGAGLVCLDRRTQRAVTYRHHRDDTTSISENSIRSLFIDRNGNLWVGMESKGLERFDEQTASFEHHRLNGGTAGVWSIAEDRRGSLWLGSVYSDIGVYRFDPPRGVLTPFAVPMASVRGTWEDTKGILWFATWGGGLIRYDPDRDQVSTFGDHDGLPSNFTKGILADDQGNLWISTESGLCKFDPESRTFRNYTTDDGLQSNFFWSGSCRKGRNGFLYFGGTNGFNAFHPDSIKDNPVVPPVLITNFKLFDKPILVPRSRGEIPSIELGHTDNFFSLEFVALNFTTPERNRYQYMMDGVDRDWISSGSRRYAAYTNLDPGTYVFRVRGSNNDGVWNMQGTTLNVVIHPPFWQAWWFRILAVLMIAGGLYRLHRFRVHRLLEMERLRVRISADLHDDVGSELSHIALASQLLSRKVTLAEKDQHQLESIGDAALHASLMMREVVWMLNPNNDSLENLVFNMRTLATQFLEDVTFNFQSPAEGLSRRIKLHTKRNLFLMYKETLNNIAKHSGATYVSIDVRLSGHQLLLDIRDNGKGFDLEGATSGNGLRNLRSRTAQINGNFAITSTPGKGTLVAIRVSV